MGIGLRTPSPRSPARRGYEACESLAAEARALVAERPCESGCPSCAQSPKGGDLEEPRGKAGAVALLGAVPGRTSMPPWPAQAPFVARRRTCTSTTIAGLPTPAIRTCHWAGASSTPGRSCARRVSRARVILELLDEAAIAESVAYLERRGILTPG